MKDGTRQQDRMRELYDNFLNQDMKTRKEGTAFVSPVREDITTSKKKKKKMKLQKKFHNFSLLERIVEAIVPLNSKCKFSLILLT